MTYQSKANSVTHFQDQNATLTATATLPQQLLPYYSAHPPPMMIEECYQCSLISSQPGSVECQAGSSRRFDPANHYASCFTIQDIQVQRGRYVFLACPDSRQCPCCHLYDAHYDCPVVSIHGVCSNGSKTEVRSASGVFFGPNNKLNLALPLDGALRHTGQVAELAACIYAVNKAGKNLEKWKRERAPLDVPSKIHTLVIKSDSAYIVCGITEWVQKWKSNGWKNCKGQPVANADGWKILDGMVETLEKEIYVKFWLVSREDNAVAENAAKHALDYAKDLERVQRVLGDMELT